MEGTIRGGGKAEGSLKPDEGSVHLAPAAVWVQCSEQRIQISQFFASGGQSIGVSGSASVLPMNTQD